MASKFAGQRRYNQQPVYGLGIKRQNIRQRCRLRLHSLTQSTELFQITLNIFYGLIESRINAEILLVEKVIPASQPFIRHALLLWQGSSKIFAFTAKKTCGHAPFFLQLMRQCAVQR